MPHNKTTDNRTFLLPMFAAPFLRDLEEGDTTTPFCKICYNGCVRFREVGIPSVYFVHQVVPRRRLKQFAINFPRAEGNGAGQGTERGVVEPGYRKNSEQGFWKESIRGKPISFSVVTVPVRLSEMSCCIAFVILFNILKASSRALYLFLISRCLVLKIFGAKLWHRDILLKNFKKFQCQSRKNNYSRER